jgi:hypothetical protein
MGHYYGKYGFDALSLAKSMLISPPDVAIEHLYSPFNDAKNQALKGWFECSNTRRIRYSCSRRDTDLKVRSFSAPPREVQPACCPGRLHLP